VILYGFEVPDWHLEAQASRQFIKTADRPRKCSVHKQRDGKVAKTQNIDFVSAPSGGFVKITADLNQNFTKTLKN